MTTIQLTLDPGKLMYRTDNLDVVLVRTWQDDSEVFYGIKISESSLKPLTMYNKKDYQPFIGQLVLVCK